MHARRLFASYAPCYSACARDRSARTNTGGKPREDPFRSTLRDPAPPADERTGGDRWGEREMQQQRLFGVMVLTCGLALMAGTAQGNPQTQNFFLRKEVACRVHVPQHAANTNPPAAAGQSWQAICDVANYPSQFNPDVQYPDPDVHECTAGKPWPQCDDSPGPEPDLGFRYPVVTNGQAPGTHQNPAVDWWSVCAKADLSDIQSVPGVQDCGTGNQRQEIGQCRASAGYYENLRDGSPGYPAESFF